MWLLLRRQHKSPFIPNLLPISLISLTSFITIPVSQRLPPARPNQIHSVLARVSPTLGLWHFFLKQMCFGYLQKYKHFCRIYYSP